jgi:putative transposase
LEVHDHETVEFASQVLARAVWSDGCLIGQPVFSADNGSPMKGATMDKFGVIASFSGPRVCNANALLFLNC